MILRNLRTHEEEPSAAWSTSKLPSIYHFSSVRNVYCHVFHLYVIKSKLFKNVRPIFAMEPSPFNWVLPLLMLHFARLTFLHKIWEYHKKFALNMCGITSYKKRMIKKAFMSKDLSNVKIDKTTVTLIICIRWWNDT